MTLRQNIKVTVDVLVFSEKENRLFILLVKRKNEPYKGNWVLPGGFVDEGESLEIAAKRELEEETSVRVEKLWQFGAYGDPKRDPRGHTVTVAYRCEVDKDKIEVLADTDAAEAKWFGLNKLPLLGFDHLQIVKDGAKHRKMSL